VKHERDAISESWFGKRDGRHTKPEAFTRKLGMILDLNEALVQSMKKPDNKNKR